MGLEKYRWYGFFLAACMLTFGTLNTVFTKYQNEQSFNCTHNDSREYECEICLKDSREYNRSGIQPAEECIDFEQPIYQTFVMFMGEFVCFFIFYITLFFQRRNSQKTGEILAESKLTGWRKLIFVIPTLCDMTATTLMNLGLIYTHASIYQMLRGAVVIFTGIMSIFFLKRKQYVYHWLGMFFVVCGIAVVGLASVLYQNEGESAKNPLLGDGLIILAQVFTAFQFVYEEKYLSKYEVPALQAVGFEGLYGVFILAVLMPIFQVTAGEAGDIGNFFDIKFAFEAFLHFPSITVSSIGCILSIAFFNYFGLTITKVLSATSRSTIDACRTISVFFVSLAVGWEFWNKYTWVQLSGFVVLILGTFTYNKVITYKCFNYDHEKVHQESEESKPLRAPLADSEDEEGKHHNDVVYNSIN